MKNYKEAQSILEKIKLAQKILLCLHVNPDGDSIGSNLALARVLEDMGKNTAIYSADEPQENLDFLPGREKVIREDPNKADFEKYDLVIFLDSAEKLRVTRHDHLPIPEGLSTIVIDHHSTNEGYGQVNLIDSAASSTSEILYSLLKSWKARIDPDTANCLLAAICSDTGTFRWATSENTLEVASQLIKNGANFEKINFNLYSRNPLEMVKYQAEVVRRMKREIAGKTKFLWSATSFEDIEKMGGTKIAVGGSDIGKTVEGIDFALVIREEEKGTITGSLRSRTDVDVSKIASSLGGGGHKAAAGFSIKFEGSFDDKVSEIIEKIKPS